MGLSPRRKEAGDSSDADGVGIPGRERRWKGVQRLEEVNARRTDFGDPRVRHQWFRHFIMFIICP